MSIHIIHKWASFRKAMTIIQAILDLTFLRLLLKTVDLIKGLASITELMISECVCVPFSAANCFASS